MERRVSERKNINLDVRYFYLGMFIPGTVRDLSENGMFVNTAICCPPGIILEIIINSNREVLKMPAKVNRIENTSEFNRGMGFELLQLPKKYLELLIRHSLVC
jgi:hypothetical protein